MGVLTLIFFLTRLIHLTIIPIFTDEAIYLWWAKIGLLDNSQRFISLTDGKQPLLIWMFTLMMKVISDPLVAGRVVSVLVGYAGFLGMFFAGRQIFKKSSVGIWSAFIYLISSFTLVYDRLALYDSLVGTLTIWSLYLIVLLIRRVRLDVALILGLVFGAGMLTKTNTLFNILLLPASFILADTNLFTRRVFFRWLFYILLAAFMAFVFYNALRVSPWFYIIGRKNEEFIYPLREWIHHPLQFFLPNLEGLSRWLLGYLHIPFSILILAGLMWGKTFARERLFLFWAFLFPFISLGLFGKVLFPRFLLSMAIPLFFLAAYGLYYLQLRLQRLKVVYGLLIVALFSQFFITDFFLLFDPVKADIPDSDRKQLMDDWPSGYGVFEVRDFLRREEEKHDVCLATEGTFGLFPAAFELYFVGDPRMQIHGYWPVNEDTIRQLAVQAREKNCFIVFKETKEIPSNWPLQKIFEIKRGRGPTYLRFYRILPGH